MRKGWLIIVALVLLGVGYLGAQAYSSHVFERELVRTLAALRADERWQVTREAIERGWFLSSGRVRFTHADNDDWRVSVPYDARHGLLNTRLSGALQAHLRDAESTLAEQALFGDLLPSAAPRWTAIFHSLERRGEGRLDVAAFTLEHGEERLAFTGAEIDLEGRDGDIRVRGQIAPLHLEGMYGEVVTGPLHLNNRYQFDSKGLFFHQRNELILDHLDYQGQRRPAMTLSGLRYSDETRLDDQLRLDAALSLEQARVAGENLLAGRLETSLERVDGDAARHLLAQLKAAAEEYGGDLAGLDEARRRALIERLEPALLAMLADSPRLALKGATLTSPMFGVDMRGSGELVFDGRGSDALSLVELYSGNDLGAWRERLDGRFIWHDVPPLLALQLGLPLEARKLEVVIEAGEIRINGRALPSFL